MNKINILVFAALCWFTSCSEEQVGQYATDGKAPGMLSELQVEPMPGGAKIYYQMPKESDISYVKGVYMAKGKQYVVRSSVYSNYLQIEGLGSTDPLDVTLYLVDHSENHSVPVVKTIIPGTPPVQLIFRSMKMQTAFGGVNLTWDNETGTEIGITVSALDSLGELVEGETLYSDIREGDYTFRGYDDSERLFAISLTDKWGNKSDTLKGTFTPYFEKILDRTLHKRPVPNVPGDNNTQYNTTNWAFDKLFDGVTDKDAGWHTKDNSQVELPLYFTIDMGAEAKLSRFKLWHRPGSYFYSHNNIKEFEVWGSASYKTGMTEDYWQEGGDWEKEWVFLGTYETIKPSGPGAVTNTDKEFATAGFEFQVPIETPRVRYLRFAMRSNWSGGLGLHIAEISFYGNDKE